MYYFSPELQLPRGSRGTAASFVPVPIHSLRAFLLDKGSGGLRTISPRGYASLRFSAAENKERSFSARKIGRVHALRALPLFQQNR